MYSAAAEIWKVLRESGSKVNIFETISTVAIPLKPDKGYC